MKVTLVYEQGTDNFVRLLSNSISDCGCVPILQAIQTPEMLCGDTVGIVYKQKGKGVSQSVIDFVNKALLQSDINNIEYLFSVCLGNHNPYYSLKIVERLCLKHGVAVSYNKFIPNNTLENDETKTVAEIQTAIQEGKIALAYGSVGTYLYMKLKKIK